MEVAPTKTHITLLTSPGMGHLIPVLELGQCFAVHHGFLVTIFVVTTDASTAQQLPHYSSYRDLLNIVFLSPVGVSDLVTDSMAILSQLVLIMRHAMPILRAEIAELKPRPLALVVDLFGTEAFEIADDFGMLKYVFNTTNAWFLALTLYYPHHDETSKHDHVYLHKPLDIPGCAPLEYEGTLDLNSRPDDRVLQEDYAKMGLDMAKADGILVNSWECLEPRTLKALRDPNLLGRFSSVPVHPVGPLIRPVNPVENFVSRSKVLDWLDLQPARSVLYVSFGSGGTLSADQLTELAWGLEVSQQRFVWVVRPPIESSSFGSYFRQDKRTKDGTPDYLPDGFVSRTREVGLVVEMWAPQTEILAHESVGAFLSHGGWNSILESVVNEVPMICWPLYAEQGMNAAMLSDHLGMATRSREVGPGGVVEREVIKEMIRRAMEKDQEPAKFVRAKVLELKRSAEAALAKGGSSRGSLEQVAKECETGLRETARGA
ncbi:UDP-glycosyltransferase 72E1-like [Syzygium oleosum]|uniref:UDP-glycosyltransferase 72E1-like n=1 Tax=Syzygium oleosum TaxID=219896 RepID=UPI0011D27A84|nr:UDP-glycosyltransferase 72E1-like [Syzygium oleosum]